MGQMMDGNLRKLLFVCLTLMVPAENQEELSTNKVFILITDQKMSWDAAQDFCWRDNRGLASISDESENSMIHNMIKDLDMPIWIGLDENISSWTWSLKEPWSQFDQQWEDNELDNVTSLDNCASITNSCFWRGRNCMSVMPFFCNDGENPDVLVSLKKNWSEALDYCRDLYQDLSSVFSLDHNKILANKLQGEQLEEAWIGLYRDAWTWFDGTAASFRHWAPEEPKNDNTEGCAAMSGESWYDRRCDLELNFVCQQEESAPPTTATPQARERSRIFLKTKLLTDGHLTNPGVRANLLQQFQAALEKGGLADVEVKIVKVERMVRKVASRC